MTKQELEKHIIELKKERLRIISGNWRNVSAMVSRERRILYKIQKLEKQMKEINNDESGNL